MNSQIINKILHFLKFRLSEVKEHLLRYTANIIRISD